MSKGYTSYQEKAISLALTYRNAAENTEGKKNYLIARLIEETLRSQGFDRKMELSRLSNEGNSGFKDAVSSFLFDLSFTANMIFQANIQEDSEIRQTALEIEKIKDFAARQGREVYFGGIPEDMSETEVTPQRVENLAGKIPNRIERRVFA